MNWLHYLLEANLYLGVFYLCYCLFLNKETYYTLNRIYLILTCIISFIIPIVQLGILKPAEPVVQSVIVITTPNILKGTISNHIITAGTHFKWADAIVFIYLMGAITLIVIFIIKLYQLAKLINSKPAIIHDRYKLICINESNSAFSFFSTTDCFSKSSYCLMMAEPGISFNRARTSSFTICSFSANRLSSHGRSTGLLFTLKHFNSADLTSPFSFSHICCSHSLPFSGSV